MRGIYIIRCTQEETVYIGSSIDVHKRWSEHRNQLRQRTHHCAKLQLAWDAYGDESFIFEVLEHTDDLVQREQAWLDKYINNCYNSSSSANNPMRSKDAINKMNATFKAKGSRRGRQILTDQDVYDIKCAIRDKTSTGTALAKKYNCSTSLIHGIKTGVKWAHIDVEGFTPGRNNKSTDYIEEIIFMKQEGLTHKQIVERLGLKSESTISYILSKS
jgi:group I intron endonuclease